MADTPTDLDKVLFAAAAESQIISELGRAPISTTCPSCRNSITKTKIDKRFNQELKNKFEKQEVYGVITFFITLFILYVFQSFITDGVSHLILFGVVVFMFILNSVQLYYRCVYKDVTHSCPDCHCRLGVNDGWIAFRGKHGFTGIVQEEV